MKVFFWGEPQRGFVIGALRRMGEVRRGYGEKTGTKFPSASSQPSCYIPPLSFFFVFFLLPSFLSPSFHPSLPHIHDPVINLVEISRSLINACPPSSPPPHLFSSRLLFLFRLYRILGFYFFFLLGLFISSLLFCLSGWWEWGNVQCEGSKRGGLGCSPPTRFPRGTFFQTQIATA